MHPHVRRKLHRVHTRPKQKKTAPNTGRSSSRPTVEGLFAVHQREFSLRLRSTTLGCLAGHTSSNLTTNFGPGSADFASLAAGLASLNSRGCSTSNRACFGSCCFGCYCSGCCCCSASCCCPDYMHLRRHCRSCPLDWTIGHRRYHHTCCRCFGFADSTMDSGCCCCFADCWTTATNSNFLPIAPMSCCCCLLDRILGRRRRCRSLLDHHRNSRLWSSSIHKREVALERI